MSAKAIPLRLVAAVVLMAILLAPVADYMTRPDYKDEAQRTRALLVPVETLRGFLDTLQQAGMRCETLVEQQKTVGFCRRTNGLPIWSWLAWFEMFPKGVTAYGEFIDGQKSSDYRVSVQTMGP